jgi:hypothetical protein
MKDDKQLPYHMRDDSDDESASPPPEYDGSGADSTSKEDKKDPKESKSGFKELFGRKAKIGNVQLDPGIGVSIFTGRRLWGDKLTTRLCRLDGIRSGFILSCARSGRWDHQYLGGSQAGLARLAQGLCSACQGVGD